MYRCDFYLIFSYPSLLISSSILIFESVSCITDMHIILYEYLYFNPENPCLRKKILIFKLAKQHIRHVEGFFEGAKPFLIHFLGSKLMYIPVLSCYSSLHISSYSSLLILLVPYSSSSYIFLSSYT